MDLISPRPPRDAGGAGQTALLVAGLITLATGTLPPVQAQAQVQTQVQAQPFSRELWEANQDVYDAILEHPFLTGMQDGSLEPETFAFYIVQDAAYLRAFAEALTAAARSAPDTAWARRLGADADSSLAEERRLHEQVFAEHGITSADAAAVDPTPNGFAYASYLVATAHARPFEEAIAALLPCYWIYWEVGKALQAQGSPNATYQAWIDAYVSPGYAGAVAAVVAMVDVVALTADAATRERMHAHFRRSARYEWMFWDAAYRRQTWPLAGLP